MELVIFATFVGFIIFIFIGWTIYAFYPINREYPKVKPVKKEEPKMSTELEAAKNRIMELEREAADAWFEAEKQKPKCYVLIETIYGDKIRTPDFEPTLDECPGVSGRIKYLKRTSDEEAQKFIKSFPGLIVDRKETVWVVTYEKISKMRIITRKK